MVMMVVVVSSSAEDLGRLDVLLQLLHVSLELGPPVLEPGDHLGVRQAECQCNLFHFNEMLQLRIKTSAEEAAYLVSIGRRQVLLIEEPLLQFEDLMIGERRPGFALLFRLLARAEQGIAITAAVTTSRLASCNAIMAVESVITVGNLSGRETITDLARRQNGHHLRNASRRDTPPRKTFSRRAIRKREASTRKRWKQRVEKCQLIRERVPAAAPALDLILFEQHVGFERAPRVTSWSIFH